MTETYSEERATAIHEAGHAVTAYLLGRPFVEITVVKDEDALGQVLHAPPTGDWFRPDLEMTGRIRTRIEQHVMISIAGSETQARWAHGTTGQPPDLDARISVGARYDQQAVVLLALYACGSDDETSAYIEWLRQRVLNTINDTRYWRLVEALADAVTAEGTIRWRRARRLLQEADRAWMDEQIRRSPVWGNRHV